MTIALGLLPLLLIFAAWAILGAAVASWFPLLARPLIPRSEMTDEVRRAGIASFHTLRLGRTAGANGLLIYVSLFERTVWVCADDAIAERLPDDAWIPVRDTITAGFRRGTDDAVAASLRDAVARAADLLAPHFPVRAADADELPNHLHVLD
jgi:putative membrane protein